MRPETHAQTWKDVVWAQEEPRNNGAWFFVEPRLIEESLIAAGKKGMRRAMPGGRVASGLARHRPRQAPRRANKAALVADALGLLPHVRVRTKKPEFQ